MINLGVVFPEMSKKEQARIGRRAYANLGRSMVEILLLGKIDKRYIDNHVVFEVERLQPRICSCLRTRKPLRFTTVFAH